MKRRSSAPPLRPGLVYALALLPVLILEALVFPRLPFPGAQPFLFPAAVCLLALREGIAGGAKWGLLLGFLAYLLGEGVSFIFLLSLLGAICGYAFRYGLQRGFLSCLLLTALGQFILSLLRMGALALLYDAPFLPLFGIALPELAWSLCFFPLVYLLFWPPSGVMIRGGETA